MKCPNCELEEMTAVCLRCGFEKQWYDITGKKRFVNIYNPNVKKEMKWRKNE